MSTTLAEVRPPYRVVRATNPSAEVAVYRSDEISRKPDVVARARKFKEIGLKAQAARVQRESNLHFAETFFYELSGRELRIWLSYLPTAYIQEHSRHWSRSSNRLQRAQDWDRYYFDTIPEPAEQEISTAMSLRIFDWMEVWSPEVPRRAPRLDPMVVGIISHNPWRFFAVTRWAESLISTEEAEVRVRELHQVRGKHCGERRIRVPGEWRKLCLACGDIT